MEHRSGARGRRAVTDKDCTHPRIGIGRVRDRLWFCARRRGRDDSGHRGHTCRRRQRRRCKPPAGRHIDCCNDEHGGTDHHQNRFSSQPGASSTVTPWPKSGRPPEFVVIEHHDCVDRAQVLSEWTGPAAPPSIAAPVRKAVRHPFGAPTLGRALITGSAKHKCGCTHARTARLLGSSPTSLRRSKWIYPPAARGIGGSLSQPSTAGSHNGRRLSVDVMKG